MPTINLEIHIKSDIETCFDLSRSIDLHKISTANTNEEAIDGTTSGLINMGEFVTWQATHFGIKYSNIQGENQVIADKDNNRFLIMTIGWQKNHFVHDCPMHFDIINGKVWVQSNMTEWNVGEMLEEQGVSKTDIVLGFLAPSTRVYSDYALA